VLSSGSRVVVASCIRLIRTEIRFPVGGAGGCGGGGGQWGQSALAGGLGL
jgi:hypothetical protein